MSDIHDFTVKFDGQGYLFEVFVNTNEDPVELAKRLQKAARGQIKAACSVAYKRLDRATVEGLMAALAKVATSPTATEFEIK